jgi:hypothetical protein
VAADCTRVRSGRVDDDPVMPAILEQVAGDRPDGVLSEAAAVVLRIEEEIQSRMPELGVRPSYPLHEPDEGPPISTTQQVRALLASFAVTYAASREGHQRATSGDV